MCLRDVFNRRISQFISKVCYHSPFVFSKINGTNAKAPVPYLLVGKGFYISLIAPTIRALLGYANSRGVFLFLLKIYGKRINKFIIERNKFGNLNLNRCGCIIENICRLNVKRFSGHNFFHLQF